MIETFFNISAKNIRRTTSTPTSADAITTGTAYMCAIRPIAAKAALFVDSNMGKEYDLLCDTLVDQSVGDLVVANSQHYSVIGVSEYYDYEDDQDSYLAVRVAKK